MSLFIEILKNSNICIYDLNDIVHVQCSIDIMSLDPSSKALRRVINSAPNGIPVISEELTKEIIKERNEFWAAYEKRVIDIIK